MSSEDLLEFMVSVCVLKPRTLLLYKQAAKGVCKSLKKALMLSATVTVLEVILFSREGLCQPDVVLDLKTWLLPHLPLLPPELNIMSPFQNVE